MDASAQVSEVARGYDGPTVALADLDLHVALLAYRRHATRPGR